MADPIDKPEHWRDLAEKMRTVAARMRDPEARRLALNVAEGYQLLAKRVEERAAAPRKRKPLAGTAFIVEVEGIVRRGTYEVAGSVITVRSGVWGRTAPLGEHAHCPKAQAKAIPIDAVRSGAVGGKGKR